MDHPTTGSGTQVDIDDSTTFDLKDILDPVRYVEDSLIICTTVLTIIGFPINLFLLGAIFFFKRLHLNRNFVWIGIGFSNLFVLVAHLMFALSARATSASTRALYVWFASLSDITATWNIVSAVFERHICVTYSEWYKRRVTICWIIALQLVFFVFIFVIFTGLANLFEEYLSTFFSGFWNLKLVGTLVTMILPFCLTGLIALFRDQTRREYPPIEISLINIQTRNSSPNNSADYQPTDGATKVAEQKSNNKGYFVYKGKNRVSQMELGARRTFHYLALIHLIFMAPTLISFISVLICLQAKSSSGIDALGCGSFMGALYYIGVIMDCLHSSIVNPVTFALLSGDILVSVKSKVVFRNKAIEREIKVDETNSKIGIIDEESHIKETEM